MNTKQYLCLLVTIDGLKGIPKTSYTTALLSMRCEELSAMFLVQVVQPTENPKIKRSGEMNPIFQHNWGGLYYSYYLYILFPSGQYTLQAWTKLPQIWVRSNTQLATLENMQGPQNMWSWQKIYGWQNMQGWQNMRGWQKKDGKICKARAKIETPSLKLKSKYNHVCPGVSEK